MKVSYSTNFYPNGSLRLDRREKRVEVRETRSTYTRWCTECGGQIPEGEAHLIEVANSIQRLHYDCVEDDEQ